MTLLEALKGMAPALQPLHATTPVMVEYDAQLMELRAGNGLIYAVCPIDAGDVDFIVDAARLKDVWDDGSTLKVTDQYLTIRRKKRQFRVQLRTERPPAPPVPRATEQLTAEFVSALAVMAEFASTNAIYPWACGVWLRENMLVATNNMGLARLDIAHPFSVVMPRMALDMIKMSDPPAMGYDATCLFFQWPSGLRMRCPLYDAQPPDVVWAMAQALTPCDEALPEGARESLEDLANIGGRFMALSPESMAVAAVAGDAEAEYSFSGRFICPISMGKLMLTQATHLSFRDAPAKLYFERRGGAQPIYGVVAGSRYEKEAA